MKHVEQIRAWTLRAQSTALARMRIYLSMVGENQEAIDCLHGEAGDLLLARVTDLILKELGHETSTPVEDPNSGVRRAVRRVRGSGGA